MAVPQIIDIDLYSEENLLEPYDVYRELRAIGPVVGLPLKNVYAVTRYAAAKQVLDNWRDFTSRFGVSVLSDKSPAALLFSDPPEHDLLRQIAARPVRLDNLAQIEPQLTAETGRLFDEIKLGETIEAVSRIARRLPVSIISNCVGLPEEGRARMLEWAFAGFNMAGPDNQRRRDSVALAEEARAYVSGRGNSGCMRAGSWGADLFSAVKSGELPAQYMPGLLMDYVGPSLDTTIAGLSNAIWCFAKYPDQWQILRRQPELIKSAISEVLRFQSPVLSFGRLTTKAVDIEGLEIPEGARLMVLFASANRDEKVWNDPNDFQIARRPNRHLAFGFGIHSCMGMHLARLEMKLVIQAILAKVEHIELLSASRVANNSLRTFSELNLRFH